MSLNEKFFKAKPRQNFEYLANGRYDRLTLANFKYAKTANGERYIFDFVPRVDGLQVVVPEGRAQNDPSPKDRVASVLFSMQYDDNDVLSLFHALAKQPLSKPLTTEDRLMVFDKLGLPLEQLASFYGDCGKEAEKAECFKKLADPSTPPRVCHFRGAQVAAKSYWKQNKGGGKPENKGKSYQHWQFSTVAQTVDELKAERAWLESIGA